MSEEKEFEEWVKRHGLTIIQLQSWFAKMIGLPEATKRICKILRETEKAYQGDCIALSHEGLKRLSEMVVRDAPQLDAHLEEAKKMGLEVTALDILQSYGGLRNKEWIPKKAIIEMKGEK